MKRLPRGYDDPGDDALAHGLRLRGFTVSRSFPKAAVHDRGLLDLFERFANDVKPLIDWGRPILD